MRDVITKQRRLSLAGTNLKSALIKASEITARQLFVQQLVHANHIEIIKVRVTSPL